jgi:hypothetical protein
MTTTHGHSAASVVPQFARAGSLLEGLAAQDFAQLGGALAAGARLRALLPPGLREWTGAQVIAGECQLSQDLLRARHSRSFYTPGHMACGDSRASRAPHR